MLKRVCPKCFTRWYSSCSTDEAWICEKCKSEIPKSLETVAENEKRVKKLIIYCPCCKSKVVKVDTTEYRCDKCKIVFDIDQYTTKKWEEINSIVVY